MNKTKTRAQLFADAADVIRKRGHAKNVLEVHPGGPVCINGALNVAHHGSAYWQVPGPSGDHAIEVEILSHYVEHLAVEYDASGHAGSVVGWNNLPQRTAEEVIEALEIAASAALSDEAASVVSQDYI